MPRRRSAFTVKYLELEQAGVPDVIPPDACYHGWQDSLAQLTAPVEHVSQD
jgi:hypothetical protein